MYWELTGPLVSILRRSLSKRNYFVLREFVCAGVIIDFTCILLLLGLSFKLEMEEIIDQV